jgi:hypothetical protein
MPGFPGAFLSLTGPTVGIDVGYLPRIRPLYQGGSYELDTILWRWSGSAWVGTRVARGNGQDLSVNYGHIEVLADSQALGYGVSFEHLTHGYYAVSYYAQWFAPDGRTVLAYKHFPVQGYVFGDASLTPLTTPWCKI